MKKLFEEVQLFEGSFKNLLRGGKVPIGHWDFVYRSNDIMFIANSAEERGMEVTHIDPDTIRVNGYAQDHMSLIASLQTLGVDGNVSEQ